MPTLLRPAHLPVHPLPDGALSRDLARDLAHDLARHHPLPASATRRDALRWLAGAGVLATTGCGGGGDAGTATAATVASAGTATSSSTSTSTSTGAAASTSTAATGSCSTIPEETAGPYPGDGSNANASGVVNALALSGIVRSDLRASVGGATGVAQGVPLVLTLNLVNSAGGCAALAGLAVYLWHCDREGRYSLYSSGVTGENYLRGVQVAGSGGSVTFTTVFPGCYAGRMPHIHFEVYRSAATATSAVNKLRTSQIALPMAACTAVYANAAGYAASLANLAQETFATDNVFADGVETQLATVFGSVAEGFSAQLTVGIAL